VQLPGAGRLVRLLIPAALAALVVPGAAQAHHTAVPIVALDYANRILPGAGGGPTGVRATLEDAGRRLRLTVDAGRKAIVLGYVGEPFLRFGAAGVAANARSETAQGLRLVPTRPVSARPADAVWTPITPAHTLAWADARAWASTPELHGRAVARWSVPLVVDGHAAAVSGELTREPKPSLWPWLLLGLLPLAVAAAATCRRRWLWAGACGLAALAGFATLADLGGFAAGGLPVPGDRWALLAVEATLTAAAIVLLTRPRARLIAVAALAAFAVLQALSELAVFRHGVVVSGLPAAAVRASAALALGAGLGAAGLVFLAPTPGTRRRPQTRSGLSSVRTSRKEQA
jgi:hypothetical protein